MLITVLVIILVSSIFFIGFVFFVGKPKVDDGYVFEEIRNPVVMQILVPRENDKTPLAAEQMFASLHGIQQVYIGYLIHWTRQCLPGLPH